MRRLISLTFVLTVLGAAAGLASAGPYDLPRVPVKGTEGPDIRNALAPRVPAGPGTR